MSKTTESIAEAAVSWLKNPFLALLASIFALVELYAVGILPAMQNTLKVQTATQENIALSAKAKNADIREQAEADNKTQEAAINTERAKYASRLKAAVARKTAAEAKQKSSVADYSPEMQQALTDIVTQESNIKGEQALQEQRKAKFLALKAQFEAQKIEAEGRVSNAIALNRAIVLQDKAVIACVVQMRTEDYNKNGINYSEAFSGRSSNWKPQYRKCLPQTILTTTKPSTEPATIDMPPKPKPAGPPVNPILTRVHRDPFPLGGNCRVSFDNWKTTGVFGAFAVSPRHCGASTEADDLDSAKQQAMTKCGDRDCYLVFQISGEPSSPAPAPAQKATTVSTGQSHGTVVPAQLNLHSKPNSDAESVIGKIDQGQQVVITGETDTDFIAIEATCNDGNACKGYVNGRAEFIARAN